MDSASRKGQPIFNGFLMYFPRTAAAVAEHSRKANAKHNPGQPLHWSREKSSDHADCAARHLIDMGPEWDKIDPEFGSLHAVALVWRACAVAELTLEKQAKGLSGPVVGGAPADWAADFNKWKGRFPPKGIT